LMVPAVPFLTTIAGGEPYGTRTGFLMFLGLPTTVVVAFAARGRWRHRVALPLAIGALTFAALAPVFIKTRFLFFSWTMWACAFGVAVAWVRAHRPREECTMLIVAFTACAMIEALNTGYELIKAL
jgi:hypothetical protein